MTHEQYIKLSDIQVITKIAEACGWTSIKKTKATGTVPYGKPPDATSPDLTLPLPDYLESLDAMHKAEETLNDRQRREFWNILVELTNPDEFSEYFDVAHASADKRAEAFVLTMTED